MNQYITVKGVYDKGTVRLLEVPDQNMILNSDVLVMIPMRKNKTNKKPKGIPINDFVKKMNLFAIGGDSIKETEELYND
jgi:hypothetical protein